MIEHAPRFEATFKTGIKNILFGNALYPGLATAERIAESGVKGDPIKPADVTFDFARDVVTSAISKALASGIVIAGAKLSLTISETVAGVLGGAVLSVFDSTSTASHGEDAMQHGRVGHSGGGGDEGQTTRGGIPGGGGVHRGLHDDDDGIVTICEEPSCMGGGAHGGWTPPSQRGTHSQQR